MESLNFLRRLRWADDEQVGWIAEAQQVYWLVEDGRADRGGRGLSREKRK